MLQDPNNRTAFRDSSFVIRHLTFCGFLAALTPSLAAIQPVFPGEHWDVRQPESLGLSKAKLDAMREIIGGRGCVVRYGYLAYTWGDPAKSADVASAVKPVISTLLLFAVQEGKVASVDSAVSEFEPRLKTLNQGKDASITWHHFASQTSGYGLAERPGQAYAYNDLALALYYDTLTQKVFGTNGAELLRVRLAEPLQFEDHYTFSPFKHADRDGRLAISSRDFARFGLLYLRGGKWRDKQLLPTNLIQMAISSPVSARTPTSSGQEADMLPGQRTLGGTRNITSVGPGFYSFNWWLNGTNSAGQRLFRFAPPDAYAAAGHGGIRVLFIVPSLELIVCWNDAQIQDHDESPGNPNTRMNQATRFACEAVIEL
jgi:CubicO group peptidase (beta-lactamase class C family)